MVPLRPNTSDTAGLTRNIVDVPVMPNIAHNKAISAYHLGVFRGGIGLGERKRPMNEVAEDDDDDGSLTLGLTSPANHLRPTVLSNENIDRLAANGDNDDDEVFVVVVVVVVVERIRVFNDCDRNEDE